MPLRPSRLSVLALLVCALLVWAALVPASPAQAVVATERHSPTVAGSTDAPPAAGSYLTVVSSGTPGPMSLHVARQSLVLISSSGQTRTVYSQRVHGSSGSLTLEDWSADGSTALLESGRAHGTRVLGVDVATGQVTTVDLPHGTIDAVVLAPDGSGFVAEEFAHGSTPYVLERVTWAGQTSTLSPASLGQMLRGPGDTVLTGGATNTRVIRTLDYATGQVLHQVRTHAFCSLVRWWDATRVLATCGRNTVLVDPVTGERTTLVPEHGTGDYGHLDVRRLGRSYYVQVAGACGVTFVGHQAADGSVHRVHVPGAVGNVVMVATSGRRLVIQHEEDCGGNRPRSELSLFDPRTSRETPLVELGPRQSFSQMLVLGEVHASAF